MEKARVALIPKGEPDDMKFRPICILDVLGKLLEHLIKIKLEQHITISDSQYGFRKGKSTIEAVEAIVKRSNYHWQALVCIDIKNAFNTAKWHLIIQKLQDSDTPEWILNLIKSYFENRQITVKGYSKTMTQGVSQGSVLGPTLWNILHDDILNLP